jgi:hypothetical protein
MRTKGMRGNAAGVAGWKCGNLTVDLNYGTLREAKQSSHPLWIEQTDGLGHSESIELSLEQAKWLRQALQAYIDLLSR